MKEVITQITDNDNYTVNAILTIISGLIFGIFSILIPILGFYFMKNPGEPTYFHWDGQLSNYIFRSYDQLAGLTPLYTEIVDGQIVSQYLNLDHGWVFGLLWLWRYPFLLFGALGVILYLLPPGLHLINRKPPRFLNSPVVGIIIALIGVGIEWILFLLLYIFSPWPKPEFNPFLIFLFIVSLSLLILGNHIWKTKRAWLFYLQKDVKSVSFYLLVIGVVIYCIFPFAWAFIQSFRDAAYRSGMVEYIPEHSTLNNYALLFEISTVDFTRIIFNSFIVSVMTTFLCVLIGAFGGYVLAQFRFKLKSIILALILSMTMFPGIVILIPLFMEYLFLKDYGLELTNSYLGLLIPYITFNLPLTLFLLYNFFQEIPGELVKAARVDGASNFQVFWKVIFPLAIPGIFTTAILVFIAAWNEFLFANLLLTTSDMWTIPKFMGDFIGIPQSGTSYDPNLLLNAATVVVTTPLILLVLIFQKQIIAGITTGAVKG
ncbi:MAG: carbohydrate ABC transporter permease [Candidatus Hodarchaeales archaeon]